MCTGVFLEYLRTDREKQRKLSNTAKDELVAINIATIAMAYNLELCVHMTFQNIIPHYKDSHKADTAVMAVPRNDPQRMAAFLPTINQYPCMMMTAPDFNFLEHDFLEKLPFVIGREPEILKKANWLIHLARLLRGHLHDRNSYIEAARTRGLARVSFPEIVSDIQVQASLANAECVDMLQLLEQIPIITQTLESVGRSYKNAGKPTTLIPPDAFKEAIVQLRKIVEPLIQRMPDQPEANNSSRKAGG